MIIIAAEQQVDRRRTEWIARVFGRHVGNVYDVTFSRLMIVKQLFLWARLCVSIGVGNNFSERLFIEDARCHAGRVDTPRTCV
jgi:hypothetical protein